MILSAGKLDKRVKLYEPTQNIVVGTHTPTYQLKYTVWANIRQLTLRELTLLPRLMLNYRVKHILLL